MAKKDKKGTRTISIGMALYAVLIVCWCVRPSLADNFPTRNVEITIPFVENHVAAKGLRVLASFLSDEWQQRVDIIYKPGDKRYRFWQDVDSLQDNGYVYAQVYAPDYLLYPLLGESAYDVAKQQIVLLYQCEPQALFVRQNSRIQDLKTLQELLAREKNTVEMSGEDFGSVHHVTHLQFVGRTKLQTLYRPFDQKEQAHQAVRNEEAIAYWGGAGEALGEGIEGLRILALAAEIRHPQFPYLPLFQESGVDLKSASCAGIILPETAEGDFARNFSRAVRDINKSATYRQEVYQLGLEPYFIDNKRVKNYLRSQQKMLEKLLEKSGISKK